jgi:hypothetical protein
MNIRLTSSLTSDDENMIAPALLRAVTGMLESLPIAFVLRIDTLDGQVFQKTSSAGGSSAAAPAPGSAH